jgi:hypothetical protein
MCPFVVREVPKVWENLPCPSCALNVGGNKILRITFLLGSLAQVFGLTLARYVSAVVPTPSNMRAFLRRLSPQGQAEVWCFKTRIGDEDSLLPLPSQYIHLINPHFMIETLSHSLSRTIFVICL